VREDGAAPDAATSRALTCVLPACMPAALAQPHASRIGAAARLVWSPARGRGLGPFRPAADVVPGRGLCSACLLRRPGCLPPFRPVSPERPRYTRPSGRTILTPVVHAHGQIWSPTRASARAGAFACAALPLCAPVRSRASILQYTRRQAFSSSLRFSFASFRVEHETLIGGGHK
jgi:hypothetical protein